MIAFESALPNQLTSRTLRGQRAVLPWSAAWLLQAGALALRTGALLGWAVPFWGLGIAGFPGAADRTFVLVATFALLATLLGLAMVGSGAQSSRPWPSVHTCVHAFLILAALAACWLLPDRTGFIGDSLLRQGAIASDTYSRMFQQALPVDVALHAHLTPWLATVLSFSAQETTRLVALLAFALLLLSTRWIVPVPARHGMLGTCAPLLLAGAGIASLFTGFPRDTPYLLVMGLGLLGMLRARLTPPHTLRAGPEWVLLLMLFTHRSSLLLVVPYAVATLRALRHHRGPLPLSWYGGAAALAFGALILAPSYARIISTFDLSRHFSWLHTNAAQFPSSGLLTHLADVANAVTLLSPAALLVPILLIGAKEDHYLRFEQSILLSTFALLFSFRPQQGVFRDYDVYALAALALGFACVSRLIGLARQCPRIVNVLCAVLAASSFQSMLSTLAVAHSPDALNRRLHFALASTGAAGTVERAQWLDYLGTTATTAGDPGSAARYFSQAAMAAPTRTRRVRACLAHARSGDYLAARDCFRDLRNENSGSTIGWAGEAGMSAAVGDSADFVKSLIQLQRLTEGRAARDLAFRLLSQSPEVDPTGEVRRRLELQPR